MAGRLQALLGRLGLTTQSQAQAQVQTAITRERAVAGANLRQLSAAMESHITSSWSGTPEHINVYTASGLAKARGRSRGAAINNDHARHFVRQCHTNILGPQGIKLQVQLAKRGGQLHEQANSALEASWVRWGKKGACDVTGRYSWRMVCRLLVQHLVVDGEALLRLVDGAGPYRFAVQVIDPNLIDLDLHQDLAAGVKVRMGVEFNAEGRVLALHIKRDTAGSPDGYGYGRHARVPMEELLHIMLPEQVNQYRGIPWMNSALERLFQVSDFERAALAASRNAAKRAGFFYSQDGTPPPGFGVAEEDGEGGSQQVAVTQEGQFDTLPGTHQFVPFKSDFPHVSHAEFTKACLRGAASGLGVSYVTFGNDLEAVNYSSARVGIFEEREVWKELQQFLVDELCAPVHQRQLRMALLADPQLASLNPARLTEYTEAATWQPRRWPAIDPKKDAEADEISLRNRTTSRTRIAARDGVDLEEIAAELEREEELFANLPKPDAKPATAAPAAEPDDDETAPARNLRLAASRGME